MSKHQFVFMYSFFEQISMFLVLVCRTLFGHLSLPSLTFTLIACIIYYLIYNIQHLSILVGNVYKWPGYNNDKDGSK